MYYKIANEVFNIPFTDKELRFRFREFELSMSDGREASIIQIDFSGYDCFKEQTPHLSDIQNMLLYSLQQLFIKLLCMNKLLLHAVSVVVADKSYVFLGKPGAGKSTLGKQLLEFSGANSFILNDDRTVLGIENARLVAWRNPWSKISSGNPLQGFPVDGIYIIHQSTENNIVKCRKDEFIKELSIMYPHDVQDRVFDVASLLLDEGLLWIVNNNMTEFKFEKWKQTL